MRGSLEEERHRHLQDVSDLLKTACADPVCALLVFLYLLATSDGLALTKAFMGIKDPKLRRRIVDLVEQIAAADKR